MIGGARGETEFSGVHVTFGGRDESYGGVLSAAPRAGSMSRRPAGECRGIRSPGRGGGGGGGPSRSHPFPNQGGGDPCGSDSSSSVPSSPFSAPSGGWAP